MIGHNFPDVDVPPPDHLVDLQAVGDGLQAVFASSQYATALMDKATIQATNAGATEEQVKNAAKNGMEEARRELAYELRDVPEDVDQLPTPNVRGASWLPVDVGRTVTGLLDGTLEMPSPTVGHVEGAGCLFYAGKVNGVAGESGSGKSWTALVAAGQVLTGGRAVLYVDLEDDVAGIVGRLLALGVDQEAISRGLVYLSPVDPLDAVARELLTGVLTQTDPELVVVDSTGEALALEGANPNADEEVARWFRLLPRLLASRGAAVVVVDHTAKAHDGGLWPIGSQRKRAAIDGAQYMQETVRPFSKEAAGHAVLKCAKDRHGAYRAGERVAELHIEPGVDGDVVGRLAAPEASTGPDGQFRPTVLMERVSTQLALAGMPLSFNGIVERTAGKRTHLRTAVDVLVSEGYIATAPGGRGSVLHTSVRAYREADDDGVGSGEPVDPGMRPQPGLTGSGSLGGEPGTSRLTGSGNQSGTSGNQCPTCDAPVDDHLPGCGAR